MSQWLVFVGTIGIAALIYYGSQYLHQVGAGEKREHEVTRQSWRDARAAKEAQGERRTDPDGD